MKVEENEKNPKNSVKSLYQKFLNMEDESCINEFKMLHLAVEMRTLKQDIGMK